MWRGFPIALRFLTRLPVPESVGATDTDIGASLVFYPVVGVIISLLLVGLNALLHDTPVNLKAALLLTAWVLLTGGLHLDGLADSTDAWIGGLGDRERTLAIMKDPYCGPAAVVTVVLVLVIKAAALNALLAGHQVGDLIAVPTIARCAIPALFLTTPYVRREGMGSSLSIHAPRRTAAVAAGVSATLVAVFTGRGTLWLLATATLGIATLRGIMMRRIGGITGDTAGAAVEILEALLLVVATIR